MKKLTSHLILLSILSFIILPPNDSKAWHDETHLAIAKIAEYYKWYNAAGADIAKVKAGKRYITSTLAERLVSELKTGQEKPPHERLSDREYQVMCMIASGKSLIQIAEQLFLSYYTVRTYRSRILEKMRMKLDTELTQYAIKNNLID